MVIQKVYLRNKWDSYCGVGLDEFDQHLRPYLAQEVFDVIPNERIVHNCASIRLFIHPHFPQHTFLKELKQAGFKYNYKSPPPPHLQDLLEFHDLVALISRHQIGHGKDLGIILVPDNNTQTTSEG